MGTRRRLLAILPLAALAIAGCGGGGGDDSTTTPVERTEATTALSREELIIQGDAICAEVNAAVGTVGSTSSGAAGQAAQVAGLYGGMVERLKNLGAPTDESTGYPDFISSAEALAQAEDNVKLAAEREEEGEALSEAEAEASSALASFQSSSSSFGFKDCAETPAAPTPSSSAGGEEAETGGAEVEEVAPEEEVEEVAPEEAPAPVEEESAGGGAGVGGGTEGGGGGSGGGSSGGVGPG
jgi:uncharacterized membrane protein YgcG